MAMHTSGVWLATTKLTAPARRHDALLRPRLVDAIERAFAHSPLMLISAPAGAGKTTLLSELPHRFPETRWAWLMLDEDDNDASRFVTALRAALGRAGVDLPSSQWESMEPRHAINTIVNQIAQSGDESNALVLDDLHVISEKAVHDMLGYLADRLPPNLRLVMATRHDPPMLLARRRARGELFEVRLQDLSFTAEETGLLVNHCLGLNLSHHEVNLLHSRTEGWAAGLRLLATSLAQTPDRRMAVLGSGMQGSRRIFDFLAEEVLDRQPADLRRFLLETSILSSLDPDICDRFTGRHDSRAILEDLYRRNLYVVAADESESGFRYHDLFADFLRERLRRERSEDWSNLHVRAAHAETSTDHRVKHLLAGRHWDEAAVEIERIGSEYAARGFVVTLRRWISELPAEVRLQHPRILYLLSHAVWTQSEFAQAQPYLEQALEGFRRLNDSAGQGETLIALANSMLIQNRFEEARELAQEALTFEIPSASRMQVETVSAWDAIFRRDSARAEMHRENIYQLVESGAGLANPLALQVLLFGSSFPGGVDRLERVCARVREGLSEVPDLNHACYYTLLGATLMDRGAYAEAKEANRMALALGEKRDLSVVISALRVSMCTTSLCESRWADVEQESTQGLNESEYGQIARNWRLLFLYFEARARWHAGNLEGLRASYENAVTPNPLEAPAAKPFRAMIRGMLRVAERSFAQAEQAFREAITEEDTYRITTELGSARVLLAYTLLLRGRADDAMEWFLPYLAEAERLGVPAG